MLDVLRGRSGIVSRSLDRSIRCLILVLVLSAFGAGNLRAQEIGPRAVVSTFQDTLLATMKEAGPLGFDGRYQRLQPAMESAFDLEQMTRIVVGGRWVKLSETERRQVVELFRRFSVSTYASEFSGYGGEQFEIGEDRAQPGLGTIVETRIVFKKDKPVALNYLLRQTSQGWKIVDIYLDGTISELARRRAEFASIISSQGVDGLIALLKKKNEELAGS
ncbi:MAG TPA: ABC transporter substrate-binding protein [Candidatus Angelobacter sp.]|nr:ABC transporter substrate-binding protein [Candidatus Angelobacter sp.]